jgi:membrane protease YdiL (CAAX protease family)
LVIKSSRAEWPLVARKSFARRYEGDRVIVQHALALFLILLGPIWDHFKIRQLKASTAPDKKLKFYWFVMALTWILAAIACASVGWQSILKIQVNAAEFPWLPSTERAQGFTTGLLGALAVGMLLPAILVRTNRKMAAGIAKTLKPLEFLLPETTAEKWWWLAICTTAGIGEEILYRGFLIQYFRHEPLHATLLIAVLLSCVVFGIAHTYQGVRGIFMTALLGLLFAGLFLATGSLLIPIILHFLIDLRILTLLPGKRSGLPPA